ncbi:DNA gyrase subunit B [Kitasatospora sp. NPDC049285]|uniref:DNA gyrase subunit B n=1 Tax=Kitasatospora sp. NPDC049285 TaxID=3157096 RepID=UPI003443562C
MSEYDASRIVVLEGLDAVRKRPGMYIGSTTERGLHNLVVEVVERAVDAVLDGRARAVEVTLLPDGGFQVDHDGDADEGTDLEVELTVLQGGSRAEHRTRLAALHGVGLAVVNALSSRLIAVERRDGRCRRREYVRGVPVGPHTDEGAADGSGTSLTCWPDAAVFETVEVSYPRLVERLRELAFLYPGLDLTLTDRRSAEARNERLHFPGGVRDFVAQLGGRSAEIVAVEREDSRMAGRLEVAFGWSGAPEERIRTFVNGRPTDEGSHLEGFRDGLATGLATVSDSAVAERAGLTAVVSVKLDRPEFEGCTRRRLGNAAVRECVAEAVEERLRGWQAERVDRG